MFFRMRSKQNDEGQVHEKMSISERSGDPAKCNAFVAGEQRDDQETYLALIQ